MTINHDLDTDEPPSVLFDFARQLSEMPPADAAAAVRLMDEHECTHCALYPPTDLVSELYHLSEGDRRLVLADARRLRLMNRH